MPAPPVRESERYRRSPRLIIYWERARPIGCDCLTGARAALTAEAVALLADLDDWCTPQALAQARSDLGDAGAIAQLLDYLAGCGVVERASAAAADEPLWRCWMPAAAFFHFSTRNRPYGPTPAEYDAQLREKARRDPPPPPTKRSAGTRTTLPRGAALRRDLDRVLAERRTWRRFGRAPLPPHALATLLARTWAVQRWARVPGQGRVALKTSPSGGARHAVEAYVIAQRVRGVEPGAYHYDADARALVQVGPAVDAAVLAHALANQEYFTRAAALVVMTAVFARAMWRYPYSRAYRGLLAETGHLAQTFCLAATALDLAPFCTMAFRDSALEALIGVDGVAESALYVVGVGTRPGGRVANPGRIPSLRRGH